MSEFQLIGYLRLLADYDVAYVMVGGVASRVQGASITTGDLDIMPDPDPANLERLANALTGSRTTKKESGSTSYEPHPDVDAMEFRTSAISSFETSLGVIDVIMELPGVGSYVDVLKNARTYEFDGREFVVASLENIIVSKQTADRAKDWRAMDALQAALEVQRNEPDDYEVDSQQLDVTNPVGENDDSEGWRDG